MRGQETYRLIRHPSLPSCARFSSAQTMDALMTSLTTVLFLSNQTTPPSAESNGQSPIYVRVIEQEIKSPSHWEAILHCTVDCPAGFAQQCTNIWWSHSFDDNANDSHESDSINDKSEQDKDGEDQDSSESEALVNDGETYRIQNEVLKFASHLEILKSGERQKGSYSCMFACGEQTFSTSCLVTDFSSQNRSFLCSERSFSDFYLEPTSNRNRTRLFNERIPARNLDAEKLGVVDISSHGKILQQHQQIKTDTKIIITFVAVGIMACLLTCVMWIRWLIKKRTVKTNNEEEIQDNSENSEVDPHSQRVQLLIRNVNHENDDSDENDSDESPCTSQRHFRLEREHLQQVSRNSNGYIHQMMESVSQRCSQGRSERQHRIRAQTRSLTDSLRSFSHRNNPLSSYFVQSTSTGVRNPHNRLPNASGHVVFQQLPDGSQIIYIPASTLPSYEEVMAQKRVNVQSRRRETGHSQEGRYESPQQNPANSQSVPCFKSLPQRSCLSSPQSSLPPPAYSLHAQADEQYLSSVAETENCELSRPPSYANITNENPVTETGAAGLADNASNNEHTHDTDVANCTIGHELSNLDPIAPQSAQSYYNQRRTVNDQLPPSYDDSISF